MRQKEAIDLIAVHRELTGKEPLSESEIVASAGAIPRLVGVYFLIVGDRVIYVGQSTDIAGRAAYHKGSNYEGGKKHFDKLAWVLCEESQLDALESIYIRLLKPEFNTTRNGALMAPVLGSGKR